MFKIKTKNLVITFIMYYTKPMKRYTREKISKFAGVFDPGGGAKLFDFHFQRGNVC